VNDNGWSIGDRVRLPKVEWPMNQPYPEHEGKLGTITASEPFEIKGFQVNIPVITLDDGSVVRGYECWWEPVTMGRS